VSGSSRDAILRCPDSFLGVSVEAEAGVFTAADRVSTKPIARADLLQGLLLVGEDNGAPLKAGGPLRLCFPEGVALSQGPCGKEKEADLKNVVRLELLRTKKK